MPKLEKLSQNHIKKIPEGSAVYYQKLVDSLMNGLDGGFPSTLSLDDQGRFIVGYHQMNARLYTKKTEQED
jgi:CRISPR-associated protein Csd1